VPNEGRGRILDMFKNHREGSVPLERGSSLEHLISHHTNGVEICGWAWRGQALSLLRCHIFRGPKDQAGSSEIVIARLLFDDAKVHDRGVALGGKHDVSRLDISVDQALVVSMIETLADLNDDGTDLF